MLSFLLSRTWPDIPTLALCHGNVFGSRTHTPSRHRVPQLVPYDGKTPLDRMPPNFPHFSNPHYSQSTQPAGPGFPTQCEISIRLPSSRTTNCFGSCCCYGVPLNYLVQAVSSCNSISIQSRFYRVPPFFFTMSMVEIHVLKKKCFKCLHDSYLSLIK